MRVTVADNRTVRLDTVLAEAISQAEDTRIAVAFMSRDGLALIEPALSEALRLGATVEFVVGLDEGFTEPRAVRDLYSLAATHDAMQLICWRSSKPSTLYHPKVYLMRKGDSATSIVGSSNLTAGGLRRNVEVNAVLAGDVADDGIATVYDAYMRLKFGDGRRIPDEAYLAAYEELWSALRNRRRKLEGDDDLRRLRDRFAQEAERLPAPVRRRRDLVGWLDAVYAALPDGEFTTGQAYGAEAELQQRFPANRHVRAKIRQQLQVLRDMGFLEHLGTGRWRKV